MEGAMDMSPRGNGRFAVSVAALAVLAVLVWRTMEPGKFQYLTWLLLGMFALRIVLTWLRLRYSRNGIIAQVDYATSDTVDRQELLKSGKKTL
jgi:hypothetical protein